MTAAERERQHAIAEAERQEQGLTPRIYDPSALTPILSAMGVSLAW